MDKKLLKEYRKVATDFYRKGKLANNGRSIKYSGTVYVVTNGNHAYECYETHEPEDNEVVFKFVVRTKVDTTLYRWTHSEDIIIQNA